jgi:carbon monoxide dehydrogenase subunit G
MATLQKATFIDATPEEVWDAVRDLGALHTRLVPGFVVNTELNGDTRTVTFASGMVVKETIISLDEDRRRLAWNAEGAGLTHYNAVLHVLSDGAGARVAWTTDLLPHDMADTIGALQEQGLAAMKKALEHAGDVLHRRVG